MGNGYVSSSHALLVEHASLTGFSDVVRATLAVTLLSLTVSSHLGTTCRRRLGITLTAGTTRAMVPQGKLATTIIRRRLVGTPLRMVGRLPRRRRGPSVTTLRLRSARLETTTISG